MNLETIKEKFFSTEPFPFSSEEIWEMFGYSRHSNFIRIINVKEFYPEVCTKEEEDLMASFGTKPRFLSKKLFYLIAQKKGISIKLISKWYFESERIRMREKYLNFKDTGRKKDYRWNIGLSYSGKCYNESLNTFNLAKEIGACPYEVFKFCSIDFCGKYNYMGTGFVNAYDKKPPIPYVHFNSRKHADRFLYQVFIDLVLKEYELTDIQRKRLQVFKEVIDELIKKMIKIDIRAGRLGKKKPSGIKFLSDQELQQLKVLYRKASKLCHPDASPINQDRFIDLITAYEDKDLRKVKKMYEELSKISVT